MGGGGGGLQVPYVMLLYVLLLCNVKMSKFGSGILDKQIRNTLPHIIHSGGVDRVDQVMTFRTCKAKSRRWTMTVLYYTLDTTR